MPLGYDFAMCPVCSGTVACFFLRLGVSAAFPGRPTGSGRRRRPRARSSLPRNASLPKGRPRAVVRRTRSARTGLWLHVRQAPPELLFGLIRMERARGRDRGDDGPKPLRERAFTAQGLPAGLGRKGPGLPGPFPPYRHRSRRSGCSPAEPYPPGRQRDAKGSPSSSQATGHRLSGGTFPPEGEKAINASPAAAITPRRRGPLPHQVAGVPSAGARQNRMSRFFCPDSYPLHPCSFFCDAGSVRGGGTTLELGVHIGKGGLWTLRNS